MHVSMFDAFMYVFTIVCIDMLMYTFIIINIRRRNELCRSKANDDICI